MPITLPDLPYDMSALEPHLSRTALELHHDKHHRSYVEKTNELIHGTALDGEDLDAIVLGALDDKNRKLFNQASQAWNHGFLWHSMRPAGGSGPVGDLAARIQSDFGSLDAFAGRFRKKAVAHFGSGWIWLVLKDGRLSVTSTHDGDSVLAHDGIAPLLVLDVWEHAYYSDYQNRRDDYVDAWLGHLINWTFAGANLHAVTGPVKAAA